MVDAISSTQVEVRIVIGVVIIELVFMKLVAEDPLKKSEIACEREVKLELLT